MMAASRPSKAPARAMTSLPECPSSAGVPSSTTVPGTESASASERASRARKAPTPAVALVLCPQAGPISGRQGGEGEDSCGGGGGGSAGVAGHGQGVVFGQNGDGAAVAGAGRRSQSGLDSVQSRVGVDAAGAQHRGDLGDGVVLVVGGFGQ